MATAVTTYPKLGMTAWRTLRVRAAQAPSTKFTSATVAAILGHDSPESAAQNVVYPMQKLGLIDENGTLTDRGNKWRIDASYAEACQEILDHIYPPELAGFTTADGGPDKAMVTRWFLQKFGDSNAKQMATTYVMIADKKVPEAIDKEAKPRAKRQQTNGAPVRAGKSAASAEAVTLVSPAPAAPPVVRPAIHLDFQIHIAADTKPEVVDQIFASMAKHLYSAA
jgi:hypothetical protein